MTYALGTAATWPSPAHPVSRAIYVSGKIVTRDVAAASSESSHHGLHPWAIAVVVIASVVVAVALIGVVVVVHVRNRRASNNNRAASFAPME